MITENQLNRLWYKSYLRILSLTAIIFLITFPELSPVVQTGLDGSANFAFNYFFTNAIQTGVDVVFTYGPLGFLKAPLPLGNNLVIAILFISLLRLLFIFLVLYLGQMVNSRHWLVHFFIALILVSLLNFDLSIIGVILLSLIICFETKKTGIWFFLAIFLSVLAVIIKASIGINALAILVSFTVLDYIEHRKLKVFMILIITTLIAFILIWLIVYGNLNGIDVYFYGTYQFIKGNSSAVALYPHNNWFLVTGFILIFLALPFLSWEKRIFFLYGIILLSLFAFWKYSFSREENFHLKSLLDFTILVFGMVILYSRKFRIIQLVLMSFAIMFYYINMDLTDEYEVDDRVSFIGINNFLDVTINYTDWVESSNNQSERNLMTKKLDHKTSNLIGDKRTDIYPWDYSYIIANDLNWMPRPVIQSYAAYTPWLDNLNAIHFESNDAPEYILWELQEDSKTDEFGDVDNRYLLNDEPQTIYQIFRNYDIINKDRSMLVLERSDNINLKDPVILKTEQAVWNTWIKVPDVDDGILRARMLCRGNLLRIIRTFLYKDASFFIDYKLEDGRILKYRIVPETAKDGIWINPMLLNVSDEYIEPLVKEIMFSVTSEAIMRESIDIEWELISLNEDNQPSDTLMRKMNFSGTNTLFGKYVLPNKLVRSYNDFEKDYPGWSSVKGKQTNLLSYSGDYSVKLDTSDRFSPTYSVSVEGLGFPPSTTINVTASALTYLTSGSEGNIVITVERSGKTVYWNAIGLQEFSVANIWSRVTLEKNLPQDLMLKDLIKIYVWNNGYNEIFVDDMKIRIENAD